MMDAAAAWEGLTEPERALAERLVDEVAPLGAAKAHRFLADSGHRVSQATVSRSLARLDAAGITTSVGRAGRQLAPAARAWLERRAVHHRRNQLADSIFVDADRARLEDLLRLRRQIEVEAVTLAVERATDDDLDALDACVLAYAEHRRGGDFSKDAIDFHVLVCRATHSLPYVLIAEALLPEMGRLEPILVLASEVAHESARSNVDHDALAAALRKRDAERCREIVAGHFDAMLSWLAHIDDETFDGLTAHLDASG